MLVIIISIIKHHQEWVSEQVSILLVMRNTNLLLKFLLKYEISLLPFMQKDKGKTALYETTGR